MEQCYIGRSYHSKGYIKLMLKIYEKVKKSLQQKEEHFFFSKRFIKFQKFV